MQPSGPRTQLIWLWGFKLLVYMILHFISPYVYILAFVSLWPSLSVVTIQLTRLAPMFVCVNVVYMYVCITKTQKQGSWPIFTCCHFKGNSFTDHTVTNPHLPSQSLSPRDSHLILAFFPIKYIFWGMGYQQPNYFRKCKTTSILKDDPCLLLNSLW